MIYSCKWMLKPVMDTSFPENFSADKKRMIVGELLQGHQLATQLKNLFQKPAEFHGSPSEAEDLLVKIERSLTHSISVLTSGELDGEVSESLVISGHDNASKPVGSLDDLRSEDSAESGKKSPAAKEKRGCYRRRKNAQTWTFVKPTVQDNHAWRKYGQKEILNSKYPRSYFRCTHKFDQGCKAIRQIQRMEENPAKYHITYIGVHTCKQVSKTPQMIRVSGPSESFIINRKDSETQTKFNEHPQQFLSPSSLPSTQHEHFQQETSLTGAIDFTDNLSALDTCSLWGNSGFDDLTGTAAAMLSMESDNGDTMYSGTDEGSHSFGLDFGSTDFHFDETYQFFDDNIGFPINEI